MNKKAFISKHKNLVSFCLYIYNRIYFKNRISIKNNTLKSNYVLMKNVQMNIHGTNNEIIIEDFSRLINTVITVKGNNNKIIIGKSCFINQTEFHIEDDNNEISIGENTTIYGKTHLAAIESTKIYIGNDCMFSSDIHFMTGDAHSIIDLNGKRINSSNDIIIGNHVWIGTKVTILKNVEVGDNCIVGAASTLNKKYVRNNCIIAGVPAKVLKTDVDWLRKRI